MPSLRTFFFEHNSSGKNFLPGRVATNEYASLRLIFPLFCASSSLRTSSTPRRPLLKLAKNQARKSTHSYSGYTPHLNYVFLYVLLTSYKKSDNFKKSLTHCYKRIKMKVRPKCALYTSFVLCTNKKTQWL